MFAQLAKEKSIHRTASDGGYLGEIQPALLRSELRNALVGARPGSFTGVVNLPEGYAIADFGRTAGANHR